MELIDIITLVKAGYTKDEISKLDPTAPQITEPVQVVQPQTAKPVLQPVQMAMDLPAPSAVPVPAQVAEPVAPAVPVSAQVAEPVAPAVQEQDQPTMSQLMESIAKLTSAVQANAIAQSVIPGGTHDAPSAEDMLSEIIRPTYKERV